MSWTACGRSSISSRSRPCGSSSSSSGSSAPSRRASWRPRSSTRSAPRTRTSRPEAKIAQLADVYLAKAREAANDVALEVVRDYFDTDERERARARKRRRSAAEPSHLEALLAFAAAGVSPAADEGGADDLLGFYRSLREQRLSHEDAIRDAVTSVLMSPHFCYRVDLCPMARRDDAMETSGHCRTTSWPAA